MLRFKVGDSAIYGLARANTRDAPCLKYVGQMVLIEGVGPFKRGELKKIEGGVTHRFGMDSDYSIVAADGHGMSVMDWQLIKLDDPDVQETCQKDLEQSL